MNKLTALLSFIGILMATAGVKGQGKSINIVFIGNSITYGAGLPNPATEAPPAVATGLLRKETGMAAIDFNNQGVSGFTTVDFLPATGTAFKKAEEAAAKFPDTTAMLVFSIMLGTNDSAIKGPNGAPVSPEHYRENLQTICSRLLTDFPRAIIIINRPLWYSPNTYNGAKYLQEGLSRLQSYFPVINAIVKAYEKLKPCHVFSGDKRAFSFFKANFKQYFQSEQGHNGIFYLHPNAAGAAVLGRYWEKALYNRLKHVSLTQITES